MELLKPSHPPTHAVVGKSNSALLSPASFRRRMEQNIKFSHLPEIVEEDCASSSDSEKVYVAVGKSVEKGVGLIQWSLDKFGDREICLVHVHQPSPTIPTLLGKLPVSQANGLVLSAHREEEKEKTTKVLQNYLGICGTKVKASFIIVEADQVSLGIVDAVKNYAVRKLVMGTEPDNCMKVRRSSSKASNVAENAPSSCEIWFIHKGKHLWTREVSKSQNSLQEYNQTESSTAGDLRSISSRYANRKRLYPPDCLRSRSTRVILHSGISKWLPGEKVQMQVDSSTPMSASQSGIPPHSLQGSGSPARYSTGSEYTYSERMISSDSDSKAEEDSSCNLLLELKTEAEASWKNLLEEQQKREKLEIRALEAINTVKVLESAREHEIKLKKEAKDALRKTMKERKKLLEEREEITQELHNIMRNIALLDSQTQTADHRCDEATKELNLVQASITTLWQEKQRIWRQKLEAENWLERWRNRGVAGSATCNGLLRFVEENPGLAEFPLSDLQTATCSFSENFKIGEGGYGCVFKGEMMGRTVAIKKLHPHNLQGKLEFQQEVKVLGKLQHPYLVTLLGYCSEAWSLVYEYLPNGSLQDFLSWKKNYSPLTWKIRARIIAEIASALCFLHSSRPEKIVHGDLKPDNILVDSDMVCKISDFGISRLVHEEIRDCPSFRRSTEPKGSFSYIDPEFHRTGILTPKSDVYSFGLIILQLLTGRSPVGLASDVRKEISCGKLTSILDLSAGEWPTFAARKLADLGLQFCELNSRNRPELTPALVRELEQLHMPEERPIPSFFLCPILQEIMHDPQVAADGFTYEGEALRGWLENGRETSPMTNLKLSHLHLTPNHALRLAIQDWLCKS